ncbi:MATE family efflux transporter, partial [Campylobacter jejuni]|nr:MATE family efflux transporter [Campylobacter jejuni]
IVLYIDSFIIMLIIAIGDAMQPALSYNYAKKDFSRIKAIIKVVFFAGGFLSLFSIVLILIFGENLITLFTKENNQEFKTFAYTALMLFAFNYFFAWFNVLSGSFLTAFNKASFSLVLSLAQNLFIPLFFLLFLSCFMGLNGVWLSPFFAEFCVLILAWIFLKRIFKDLSL